MNDLNVSQIADILEVSRPTIYRYIQEGALIRNKKGRISLARAENRRFFKAQGLDPAALNVPAPKPAGRKPCANAKNSPVTPVDCESRVELQRQYIKAKTENTKIETEIKRGNLLGKKEVRENVFYYLSRIFSNMERLGSIFLDDVVSEIIKAGKLTPEIRTRWVNAVLDEVNTAKEETITRIDAIAEGQKK